MSSFNYSAQGLLFCSTFLVRRFDREGERRIHFASAMTLLGKTDGASAEDILGIVRGNWERLAKECGLSRGQIEYMRPAFGECYN